MLDNALERLVRTSKVYIKTNDCYGYYQLRNKNGQDIHATLGDTKKDLYYQIMFYLEMKEQESLKDKEIDIIDKILNNSYFENQYNEDNKN
tara:strand:- start:177 stop:449 length:273 start_codon:yes stop_codon:yes gene_type:complete